MKLTYFMLPYKMQDRTHRNLEHLLDGSDGTEAHTEHMIEVTENGGTHAQDDAGHSMQRTKNHLTEACKTLRQNNRVPSENQLHTSLNADLPLRVMVSDHFKLIGCKLLKVGSTNLRRLLYTLDNLSKLNDTNESNKKKSRKWHIDTRFLKAKQLSEMRLKLKTYKTFMFVRDPIERLVSAYRDNKPHTWLQGQTLPFNKYLMLIIQTPTSELNRHIQLFSTWCQPCSVTYDFIGQLDNFAEDINIILESVGARNLVILPERNQTGYKQDRSSDIVSMYRRNIPKDILKQLYEKYYIDYYLFGFPRPF